MRAAEARVIIIQDNSLYAGVRTGSTILQSPFSFNLDSTFIIPAGLNTKRSSQQNED
jgi:hypothetical protein